MESARTDVAGAGQGQTVFRWAESQLQVVGHPLIVSPEDWNHLTDAERDRVNRYKVERIRDQFVAGRSELRRQLGRRLNCSPLDVPITVREDGKPILIGSSVHFNVAHSGDLAVIATADRPVGVDLERIRIVPNADDLLRRFFTANEFEQYQSLPDDQKVKGFFRGWTCKEAVLKGDGRGMRIIDRCEICLDPRLPPRVISFKDATEDWAIHSWLPTGGYVAAVAIAVR